jgi:hypothetical protein
MSGGVAGEAGRPVPLCRFYLGMLACILLFSKSCFLTAVSRGSVGRKTNLPVSLKTGGDHDSFI